MQSSFDSSSNERARRSSIGSGRPRSRVLYVTSIAVVMASASMIFTARAGERVNKGTAIVVRGMNADYCDAQAIALGSDPKVKTSEDVQNLSVNCTSEGGQVNQLRTGLPQPHICWATLEELEARNSSVIVQTDPLPDNPNHCLVRDISPVEMVKALHFRG